jgi:hypothetical protein
MTDGGHCSSQIQYNSGNILCDDLDTGLNEKGFKREANEQKKISSNRGNYDGSSAAFGSILHDGRCASYHKLGS